jgi:hypothetical protein
MTEDKTTPNRVQPGPPPISDASTVLQLGATVLDEFAEKKATGPFLGTAVASGELPVRNGANNPLGWRCLWSATNSLR